MRLVGGRGDFDHVRVVLCQLGMDRRQLLGRLAEIVVADNALRLAEAGNRAGNILLEVDVIDSLGDRRSQQHQPLLLVADPLAAIDLATAGNKHGAGPLIQQPLEIHVAGDPIQPQFDEPSPRFHQVLMLGKHVPMPTPTNADTDHRCYKRAALSLVAICILIISYSSPGRTQTLSVACRRSVPADSRSVPSSRFDAWRRGRGQCRRGRIRGTGDGRGSAGRFGTSHRPRTSAAGRWSRGGTVV